MRENLQNSLEEQILEEFPPYELDELDKESILSDEYIEYLICLRNSSDKLRLLEKVREKAKKLKVLTTFNNIYKLKDKQMGEIQETNQLSGIVFPDMGNIVYNTDRYILDESGVIYEVVPRLGNILVCYHPVLPLEEYCDIETGEEKVKLGFYKKGAWRNIVVNKYTIASSQAIVKLSDVGIEVTSENAKFLVKYLSEIANLNTDKINESMSVSRLGWLGDDFVPYTEKYICHSDLSFKKILESLKEIGDYNKWKELMKKLRNDSIVVRFMMAASFASPLVEKFQINSFIVHLWGKSGNGKTLSLMICASIWGNPELGNLVTTLNSTSVASELYCNFLHNLPAIYDEYQLAREKNANNDTLVYELTEGKGKGRGTIDCGLRENTHWKNIIITSGEEPITNSSSKEGVKNRVIEIEENDVIIQDGQTAKDIISNNYGFAGKEFIEIIQQNMKSLFEEYQKAVNDLKTYTHYQKQINAMATILVADRVVSEKIFHDNPITLEEAGKYFTKDIDEADRYINLIIDIANSNINNFINDSDPIPGQIWGKLEKNNDEIEYYDFIPSKLQEILKNQGISWDGIKRKMAEKGYVIKKNNQYTINKKFKSTQQRVIRIKNIYFSNQKDT